MRLLRKSRTVQTISIQPKPGPYLWPERRKNASDRLAGESMSTRQSLHQLHPGRQRQDRELYLAESIYSRASQSENLYGLVR